MIKTIHIIGAIILYLSVNGYAQQMDQMPCEMENAAFLEGEELVYKVYYNWQFIWIPAGEVRFNLKETEDTYEVEVKGSSYPSYDGFFQVNDYYASSIDKETMQPTKFIRDVEQGKYLRYDSIVFNRDDYVIKEYLGKYQHSTKEYNFEFQDCIQDMVSVFYLLRNYEDSNIEKGLTLPINVFFDKEFYNLDVKVLDKGKRRIKGLGKQDVIHISPQIVSGEVFKEGDEMNIWVSDNESKIPLMIESAVTVGSVKAVLISHSNTKDQIF